MNVIVWVYPIVGVYFALKMPPFKTSQNITCPLGLIAWHTNTHWQSLQGWPQLVYSPLTVILSFISPLMTFLSLPCPSNLYCLCHFSPRPSPVLSSHLLYIQWGRVCEEAPVFDVSGAVKCDFCQRGESSKWEKRDLWKRISNPGQSGGHLQKDTRIHTCWMGVFFPCELHWSWHTPM